MIRSDSVDAIVKELQSAYDRDNVLDLTPYWDALRSLQKSPLSHEEEAKVDGALDALKPSYGLGNEMIHAYMMAQNIADAGLIAAAEEHLNSAGQHNLLDEPAQELRKNYSERRQEAIGGLSGLPEYTSVVRKGITDAYNAISPVKKDAA